MEQNPALEHETTLEHALDVARQNVKNAKHLLEDALAKRVSNEIDDARVNQLRSLLAIAEEDLRRVLREQ